MVRCLPLLSAACALAAEIDWISLITPMIRGLVRRSVSVSPVSTCDLWKDYFGLRRVRYVVLRVAGVSHTHGQGVAVEFIPREVLCLLV